MIEIYIDLTHTFTAKMPVYPGDPLPILKQSAEIAAAGYNEFHISTGMHVGTHMDSPLHMLENGKKLSEYEPEKFFGKGHLIDARNQKEINADLLEGKEIEAGDIVLIMTGFDKKFGSDSYYNEYPEIAESFAQRLVQLEVKIIGMDTPSPDRSPFNIHKILLQNDILIIENLTNLEELLTHGKFDIIALPAKFEAEAAPVRVVAQVY